MAISRAQLAKELEPGLNALSVLSTLGTTMNQLKSMTRNLQSEPLKKRSCFPGLDRLP